MNNLFQMSLGQQLKDSRADSTYHLDNGQAFPIFSRHGSCGDFIRCNICGETTACTAAAFENHLESSQHHVSLLDSTKAIATLLESIKKYKVTEAKVPEKNKTWLHLAVVDRDDDSPPPGCEDIDQWMAIEPKIISTLKQHTTVALLGLEYVIEINPDWDVDYIQETFYVCMLCNRRCDMDNIIDHLVESKHRLKYLEKFFPRAYSNFLGLECSADAWNSEVGNDYLTKIAWRIEQAKGRLKPCTVRRSRWDMKAAQLRAAVENGMHLKESTDLSYDDIPNPFSNCTVTLEVKNTPSDFEANNITLVPFASSNAIAVAGEQNSSSQIAPQKSCSPLPVKNQDQMTESEVKKTRDIIQREIERFRSTYKGTDVLIPSNSKAGTHLDATSEATEAIAELERKKEEFMSKLTQLRQTILQDARSSVYYEKAKQKINQIGKIGNVISKTNETTKQLNRTIEIDDDDDDIRVEKEIVRKKLSSRSPKRRWHQYSRSRSRSSSNTRSYSRSCSRSSSSRSRSRSRQRNRHRGRQFSRRRRSVDGYDDPDRFLPYANEQSSSAKVYGRRSLRFKRRESSFRAPSSSSCYRPFHSDVHLEPYNGFRTRKGNTTPDFNENESSTLWAKLMRELSVLEETLQRKRSFYEKRPEDHPHYAEEWKLFWEKRYHELKAESKDVTTYDFKPEWIIHWHQRMKALDLEEIRMRKDELKRKYGLDHCNEKESHSENDGEVCVIVQEHHWKPVKFGWKKTSHSKPEIDLADLGKSAMVESVDDKELFKNPSPPPPPAEIPSDAEAICSPEGFDSMDIETKSPSLDTVSDDGSHGRNFCTVEGIGGVNCSQHRGALSKSSSSHSCSRHLPQPGYWSCESKSGDREFPCNGLNNCHDHVSIRSLSPLRPSPGQDGEDVRPDLLHVLRMLTALEDNLGSLGPMVNQLLARALAMERTRKGASVILLEESACIDVLDTCKEKLKGQLLTGILNRTKAGPARVAVDHVSVLLQSCLKLGTSIHTPIPVPVISNVSSSMEARTAQQIATVLMKQGKANISDEELQQVLATVLPTLRKDDSITPAVSSAVKLFPLADKLSGQSQPINPDPTTTPAALDISTLIANLKAVGLLKPPANVSVGRSHSIFETQSIPVSFPAESTNSTSRAEETNNNFFADPKPNGNLGPEKQESHSMPLDLENVEDFSAEELKTLIFNFRNLTSSQQRDLVRYLRKLEMTQPEKVKNLSGSVPRPATRSLISQSSDGRPFSPLALKYQDVGNVVNPSAPDSIPIKDCIKSSTSTSHSVENCTVQQAENSRINESRSEIAGSDGLRDEKSATRPLSLNPDIFAIMPQSQVQAAVEPQHEITGEPISILTGRGSFARNSLEWNFLAPPDHQYGQQQSIPWTAQYQYGHGYYTQDYRQTSVNYTQTTADPQSGTMNSSLHAFNPFYPPFYSRNHN